MNVKVWLLWTQIFLLFSTDSFGDWVGHCSSFIFLGCVLKISLTPQCSHLQTPQLGFWPDGRYGLSFKHGEQWHPASSDGFYQEFVGFKRGKLAFSCSLWSKASNPSLFWLLCQKCGDEHIQVCRQYSSSGEVVKVLGDFFAFTCATNWWWKGFIGHQSGLSQLMLVWGPAYFLNTGFSCFLASCLFAVSLDFITQK